MPTEGIIAVEGWEHTPGVAYNNAVYYYDDPEGEDPWFDNQTEIVRSGNRAMRFRPTDEFGGGWGGAAFATPIVWAGEVSGSIRIYFRFETLPTSGKAEVAFFSWDTTPVRLTTKVYYDPVDGRLHMHQSTDQNYSGNDRPDTYGISDEGLWPPDYVSGDTVDGPLISAGRWYRLEMRWVEWNPNRRSDWRVNGVDYPSIEHVRDDPEEYQGVLFFWIGSASPSACELYLDDLLQSGNYTDSLHDWELPPFLVPEPDPLYPLGPGYVLSYRPNACGTHNDMSNRLKDADDSNIDANSWQGLDEIPPNPAASWDGIKQITVDTNAYAEILFEDCTEPWPIVAIDSLAVGHRIGAAGVGFLTFKLIYDGQEYSDTESIVRAEPDFWDNLFLGLDGHGGDSSLFGLADLSIAKFNALKMRVGFSNDVTPVPALDALLIQVAFATTDAESGAMATDEVRGTPTHVIVDVKGRSR